jgi:nucleoporin NDC1
MKAKINKQSSREIFLWRAAEAIFWSFVLQALFLIVFLFVMNFDPWHPVVWIQKSAALIVSLKTWLYLGPLGLVVCVESIVCCKDFVVVNRYCGTRFAIVCSMFSPHSLIIGILYSVIGGLTTWIHLSLVGGKYEKMLALCSSDDKKTCLIEGYLFLILNGFWIGIYFFVHDHIFGLKTLLFPVVQQLKFLQVKTELQPLMKQAMIDAFLPTIYYIVLYFWYGGAIGGYVSDFLDGSLEEKSLETMFGLLNIPLLLYSWFLSSIFVFSIYTMKLMFQVNLTEHIVFPVTPVFGSPDCLTLHQSLALADIPIIQHLGFLDLKILAEKDRGRREELFALSHPGGHPYNWNAILEGSLKLIRKFTEDLNQANIEAQSAPENKEHVISKDNFLSKDSAVASTGSFNTSVSGIRNMSLRFQNMSDISLFQSPSNITHFQSPPVNISQESITRVLKSYVTRALVMLCRKPGISFVFGELPDAKVRYLLSQCQPVIWAVQGLCHLAASSFKEDCYGVVQKDLPGIITATFQLKQALDKLQKVGNYKRSQKVEHYMKMKAALRSAVKRSLYCICVTFGDYVKELPLKKEVSQQLQNFLMFREG